MNNKKNCSRAKSSMTPCYVKDGNVAIAFATTGWGAGRREVCVGCDVAIGLINSEQERLNRGE